MMEHKYEIKRVEDLSYSVYKDDICIGNKPNVKEASQMLVEQIANDRDADELAQEASS